MQTEENTKIKTKLPRLLPFFFFFFPPAETVAETTKMVESDQGLNVVR